jgi:hypothetical protein
MAKISDEIFLSQGKYTVEILKKFQDDGLQVHDHTHDDKSKALE